jgi:ribosome biogenesis protein ENP2
MESFGNLKKNNRISKLHIENDNIKEKLNSISGFCFPVSTQLSKETFDCKNIISTGFYPSQVKCFSMENLSLKFQRNFDSNIIDFQILSKNWEKIVFLRSDNKLDFHTKSGSYYQIKILEKGCDLTFDKKKSFLYIPGINNFFSILDFNEGKFLNHVKADDNSVITCSGISDFNGIFVLGTKNGTNEFWDPRILKNCIGKINSSNYTKFSKNNGVSSLRFSNKCENMFFSGFESGEVVVYDLRCFSPLISKVVDPFNPVKCIRTNYNSKFVLVSNSNSIKYWRISSGKTKFFYHSKTKINHICCGKNTGMVFFSLDTKNIGVKYFKTLGPIPDWSKFFLK